MKLTVLGSGTMVTTKERNPSGFLLEIAGKKILLDAGHGTIRRLVDLGVDLQDIDIVFVSHFHTDHSADLFPLVHSRFVGDVNSGAKEDYTKPKLTFLGPKGLEKNYKKWRQIFWREPNEFYPMEFKEGPLKFEFDDISFEIFEVKHVQWLRSVGVIIKAENKKVVYTGDIGSDHPMDDLVEKTKNADLLITEASYSHKTPNHYSIGQVRKLIDKANIKKCLAVHIRPYQTKEAKKKIGNFERIELAKDRMIFEF